MTATTEEVRSVSSTGAEKGTKLARYSLIPAEALRELAEHYGRGSLKYADNNWRRGYEWSKSLDALQRHLGQFQAGEDFDEETGSKHIIAVAWHAFALAVFMDEFRQFDDRHSTVEAREDAERRLTDAVGAIARIGDREVTLPTIAHVRIDS